MRHSQSITGGLPAVKATPISEPEARALADAIVQVSANQSAAEALKLVEAALARAPQQPIVLNAAGGHMFRVGDVRRARELYERAIAADGSSKVLWLNLANACRSLDDKPAEGAALEKALAIDPRYALALLQKAELMERLANPKAAAAVYAAALASMASGSPVPQSAAPAVTHAQQIVSADRRALEAFLEQQLAPVRTQHADADQQRYDACRDVFLGKRPVYSNQP
jgi:tetratricopeptide (TPR) repeat protein